MRQHADCAGKYAVSHISAYNETVGQPLKRTLVTGRLVIQKSLNFIYSSEHTCTLVTVPLTNNNGFKNAKNMSKQSVILS